MVAALVAAALWREAGGHPDRFAAACAAAVAMEEVPEFDAAAARGARTAAGRPGGAQGAVLGALWATVAVPAGRTFDDVYEPAQLAAIAARAAQHTSLGLDDVAASVLRGNEAAPWDRQGAAEAALELLTEHDTHWDLDHLLEVLEKVAPDATCEDISDLAGAMLASGQIIGIAVGGVGGDADGRGREPGWQRWATRAPSNASNAS